MTFKEWWCLRMPWHNKPIEIRALSRDSTYYKCGVCGCEFALNDQVRGILPYRVVKSFYDEFNALLKSPTKDTPS